VLDTRRPVPELMELLGARANVTVHYRPDPRCRGRWTVAEVWVLPAGQVVERPVRAAAAAPKVTPAAPLPFQMTPQAGEAAYLRMHGLPLSPAQLAVSPPASGLEGKP
jgi:hypothetical protein